MVKGVILALKYIVHIKKKINIKVKKGLVMDIFYVVEKPKKDTKK